MKTKKYDCIKEKHRAALRIHEEIKNLSPAEELAYWQAKSDIALRRHAQRQQAAAAKTKENPR